MAKRLAVLFLALGLIVSFGACKQKAAEQAPAPQGGAASGGPGIVMPPGEMQVVIPEAVKGKYDTVKLIVEDKMANKMSDVDVKVGGEYKIPNSTLVVKVGDFIPDFKMDGSLITSVSADLNNPACHITVSEDGKEIFKGWLYSKFPAIHPFQHEKFGLTLKDGLKKG